MRSSEPHPFLDVTFGAFYSCGEVVFTVYTVWILLVILFFSQYSMSCEPVKTGDASRDTSSRMPMHTGWRGCTGHKISGCGGGRWSGNVYGVNRFILAMKVRANDTKHRILWSCNYCFFGGCIKCGILPTYKMPNCNAESFRILYVGKIPQ